MEKPTSSSPAPVAEASSIRKGEIFRATNNGLERLQTRELRSGERYNRIDELPYDRINSMSYEERVLHRGSRFLSLAGITLLLIGLGIPALSTLVPIISAQLQANHISGLQNALAIPDLAGVSIGVFLLASGFPRKVKEGWWQVKGQNLTADDLHGWQIAGNAEGADKLVKEVKERISRARKAHPSTP